MGNQEIKESLKKFIESIDSNRIKLIKLSSESNEGLSGILQDQALKRNVKINLDSIGTGEQNDSGFIVFGSYSVEIEDSIDEISLVSFKAEYNVILSMGNGLSYKDNLTEEQQKVVSTYFSQSGKIILFPYIRHLYDMVVRESGLFLPPLPPILFKS